MWVNYWKGGRVVEGAALEKRYTGNGIVGSNPTPSAMNTSIYKSSLKISEYFWILHRHIRLNYLLSFVQICIFKICLQLSELGNQRVYKGEDKHRRLGEV